MKAIREMCETYGPTARRVVCCALIVLAIAAATAADALEPKPLPSAVVSIAPGIKPLGRGRQAWRGIPMYDATLRVVGTSWSAAEPHALDLELARNAAADTLIGIAVTEMKGLRLGDEQRGNSALGEWFAEDSVHRQRVLSVANSSRSRKRRGSARGGSGPPWNVPGGRLGLHALVVLQRGTGGCRV